MSYTFTAARVFLLGVALASCGGSPAGSPRQEGTGGQGTGGAFGGGGHGGTGGVLPSGSGGQTGLDQQDGSGAPFDGSAEAGPSVDAGCAQLGCHSPPPNVCDGNVMKTYYDPNGTCNAGACEYRFTMQTCSFGCQAGRCLEQGSGDAGMPGTDGPGICSGPGCDGGQGQDAGPNQLCAQVRCTAVPANECDGTFLKTYPDPMGDCVNGVCNYRFTMQDCPRGCQNGACITVACTPGMASFTADVTDLDSLQTTGALPALAGGAGFEIRSYMQVKDSYAGIRVPVYAPTAMTLYWAVHYRDPMHIGSDTDYQGEWGLYFEASCTTRLGFAHIREVVNKIAAVAPANPDGGNEGAVARPVDFAAGELVGYYIRGVGYYAWDFFVTDSSVTNAFINPPRFEDAESKFLHAICPYDLYPPTMRQRYLALLGGPNDPPKPGRQCGTVVHDKRGTVAGLWFRAPYTHGTPTEARDASGNPLSIFKAETDVVYLADLDATLTEVGLLTYRIDPWNPTYKDPETITTSYCYSRQDAPGSTANGWVYLQVISDTQMQVAYSRQGACPSSFPTTGIQTYYR